MFFIAIASDIRGDGGRERVEEKILIFIRLSWTWEKSWLEAVQFSDQTSCIDDMKVYVMLAREWEEERRRHIGSNRLVFAIFTTLISSFRLSVDEHVVQFSLWTFFFCAFAAVEHVYQLRNYMFDLQNVLYSPFRSVLHIYKHKALISLLRVCTSARAIADKRAQ